MLMMTTMVDMGGGPSLCGPFQGFKKRQNYSHLMAGVSSYLEQPGLSLIIAL